MPTKHLLPVVIMLITQERINLIDTILYKQHLRMHQQIRFLILNPNTLKGNPCNCYSLDSMLGKLQAFVTFHKKKDEEKERRELLHHSK